ncbi:hypothetical protein Tco_0422654 [Tanacetum coccineum]
MYTYLKGTINIRLWYPKDSCFELTAFSYVDHAGCIDTLKSTSRGIQFLGDKLVSWMSKKHDCTAMSSAEAEYVALSASCAQVFTINTAMFVLLVDREELVQIVSRKKSSNYRDRLKRSPQIMALITTNTIVMRLLVNHSNPMQPRAALPFQAHPYSIPLYQGIALPQDRFEYLVRRIGMRCLTPIELEVLANESA